MVITRSGGSVVHPCIKEVIFVAGVPHSTPMSPLRRNTNITKRVAELPSLRYGTIGATKTTSTGPLRVSTHFHSDTIPRRASSRKFNGFTSYVASEDPITLRDHSPTRPIRPPRRVRFNLPSPDGDDCGGGGFDGGGDGVVAGKNSDAWPQTRATISHRSEATSRTTPPHLHRHQDRAYSLIRQGSTSSSSTPPTNRFFSDSYGGFLPLTASPGVRTRVHPTGRYIRGTLSPTANAGPHAAASPGGQTLLRAARDGDDHLLRDLLRRGAIVGIPEADLNAIDSSGRTVLSYIASNGTVDLLEQILQVVGLNPNKPDNEGNTPLHFAAQAGQIECLNCMLSRCRGIEIDARNNLGFTPLMKAALQGRNKCAKLLLFAGANPTLRDNGRGFRADQWARFCGRYVCADVIEKHARQRLLERSTSYGNWGGENEVGARVLMGKVVPVPSIPSQQTSHGLKSKLRKVFRTSSGPNHTNDSFSSARLVTQLTSAALCASSPVLPSAPTVPPVVKSLIRPLTVPRLQITLVNNNGDFPNNNLTQNNGVVVKTGVEDDKTVIKPARSKKKK